MESKWKKGDRVWLACPHGWFTVNLIVYQVIKIQIDDGPMQVRYRMVESDRDMLEPVIIDHLSALDDEWNIGDDDLFATHLEALEHLLDTMRRESEKCKDKAAFLLEEIERLKNREGYNKLKEKQNGIS